jgi:hypothetical protein
LSNIFFFFPNFFSRSPATPSPNRGRLRCPSRPLPEAPPLPVVGWETLLLSSRSPVRTYAEGPHTIFSRFGCSQLIFQGLDPLQNSLQF